MSPSADVRDRIQSALQSGVHDSDETTIRDSWSATYAVSTSGATEVRERFVCVQTNHVGAARMHADAELPLADGALVGCSALTPLPEPWSAAAVDAVLGNHVRRPEAVVYVTGTTAAKATARGELIVAELAALASRPQAVRIIGMAEDGALCGALGAAGLPTADRLSPVSALVVDSGDVLAGQVDGEIAEAADVGAAVVVLARMAANAAAVFVDALATLVIAEPFPFYFSGAWESELKVFRRDAAG